MPALDLSIAAIVGELLAKIVVIGVILVRGRGRPATRLTWIVIIIVVPLLGIALYVLVGEVRPGARRKRRHRHILDRLELGDQRRAAEDHAARPDLPPVYEQLARLAETVGNRAARGGNEMRLISSSREFIGQLIEDIHAAREHCHLLFYIFVDDDSGRAVTDALCAAAGRGVRCRVLIDAVGSRDFAGSRLRERLDDSGVQVVEALPANILRMAIARIDLRNHRKIVVIDGRIGYVGSQNIADESFALKPRFAPWVDAMVRLTGPLVRDLQALFVSDWYLDHEDALEPLMGIEPAAHDDGMTGQIMGTGPNFYNEAMGQLLHTAVHMAREELILTTPYFVPDESTATALCTAARRGVSTALVVPARNDSPLVAAASRGHYEVLLSAGVEIHEFQKGLLHAKTMTIDRAIALVGSANLDRRSFELNFEVSLLVYDTDFASQVRFLQRSYQSLSRPVELHAWQRRRWTSRLVENAAVTLAPLL